MASLWLLEYYTPIQSLAYPGLVFDHVPQRLAPTSFWFLLRYHPQRRPFLTIHF